MPASQQTSSPLIEKPVQDKVVVSSTAKASTPFEKEHENTQSAHQTSLPKQTPTAPNDDIIHVKQPAVVSTQKKITAENVPVKQSSKARLFDSSDSDTDAIFGGGKVKTSAEPVPVHEKRPIKTARVPTTTTPKASHSTKPSRSLFDDDDDDDLFTTTSRKTARNVPAKKVDVGMRKSTNGLTTKCAMLCSKSTAAFSVIDYQRFA